jgi:hypothetical protein
VIAEVQAASKGRSENAEAYRLYLQGQFFRDQLNEDATARGIECYQAALKLDPGLRAGLAGCHAQCRTLRARIGFRGWKATSMRGLAARKPSLSIRRFRRRTQRLAGSRLVRLELEGRAGIVRAGAGARAGSTLAINGAATFFGNRGNLDEAVALFRRAVGPRPLNVPVNRNLGSTVSRQAHCRKRRPR